MIKEKNIVLVGMPASGKSTVGVILAKVLGYRFLDCDLVIQEQEGRRLSEIIEQDGIDGFMEIENRILSGIETDRCVIATGGSAVYGDEAMKHLKENGTVVYLRVGIDLLLERLNDLHQRGVVIKEGQTFEDLYSERSALYEKYADITVTEKSNSAFDVLEETVEQLQFTGIIPGDITVRGSVTRER